VHPHGLDGGAVPDTIEGDGGRPAARVARAAPARPYVVGGHCNGAFVAFELARQIRAAGEPVRSVVVIDSPAPQQAGTPEVSQALASVLPPRPPGRPT
jgi:thioesterase domain-containing protein